MTKETRRIIFWWVLVLIVPSVIVLLMMGLINIVDNFNYDYSSDYIDYSSGDLYCKEGTNKWCGYFLKECNDGKEHHCVSNVVIIDERVYYD